MPTNPDAPLADQPGALWLQRTIGAATLIIGLLLGSLFVFTAFRLLSRPAAVGTAVLVIAAVIGVLAAFFILVGWRMALNRPNRHGSVLTPSLWFVVAALFLVGGLAMVGQFVAQKRFAEWDVPVSALALAVMAVLAGRRALKKRHQAS